ncbi:hypothetical protein [Halorubrum lacusprofundi]|uniref:Uncharacterized protein n=1 Tax=Halorubrum lacusprofundi (strain ATCC 49239 / DSM 5036 / JCM 8891 / ACAM 34) TaxID=416348 RepID=B9LUL0_HALLT|nr:hypothetical protein [Halorubrum lacusprofundi]ACM56367.1 hypothetical protein Hlac_0767 [Halorubrum lacusprofundi ATCC 49239]
MPGAGSAEVAFTPEPEFGAGPGADPTWIQPGIDVAVSDLSVQQALERSRHPDSPLPAGSRPRDFEGGIGLEFTLTDANWHDLVFANGGTALPTSTTTAPSSAWYFATTLPDGTVEPRTPTGTIITDAEVVYERASDIRVSLTGIYGFEPDDVTAPADGAIQQPSDEDAFSYHGATFSVDGLNQPLMQSTTISLAGLSRFRRGQGRHPYDAVTGAIEPAFSTDAIFTERDQLAAAVDDVDMSDYEQIGKVPGSVTFENGQGDTIEYALSDLQPTSYNWSNLVAADTSLSEPIDWHVTDITPTVTTA